MRNAFHPGFIALHVLHHAAERPVYGNWLMRELARHGYRVSCGALYPALHAMEQRGLLRMDTRSAGRRRRFYSITGAGRRQLEAARHALVELAREVLTAEQRKQVSAPLKRRAHTTRGAA